MTVTIAGEPPVPDTYIVTFDANGGQCSVISKQTDYDHRLTELPVPTRDRYVFDGWFTRAEGGERITLEKVYDHDTTVYAHWNTIPVERIVISQTEYTTYVGTDFWLSAEVDPWNATDNLVFWETDDYDKISSVSGGHIVTKAPGEATVTVRSHENPDISAECHVTIIKEDPGKRNRVDFDPAGGVCDVTSLEVSADGRLSYLPEATRDRYEFAGWFMEDGKRVTLDTVFSDSHTTVYAHWNTIEVEQVYLTTYSKTLLLGGKGFTLGCTIEPSNATYQDIKWSTSDRDVVDIVIVDGRSI